MTKFDPEDAVLLSLAYIENQGGLSKQTSLFLNRLEEYGYHVVPFDVPDRKATRIDRGEEAA